MFVIPAIYGRNVWTPKKVKIYIMSVFSKKGKKGKKLIGTWVPIGISDYLSLYGLVKEDTCSKSRLLFNLVNEFIETILEDFPETLLINILQNKVIKGLGDSKNKNLEKYKTIIEKELMVKGLSEEMVKKITVILD